MTEARSAQQPRPYTDLMCWCGLAPDHPPTDDGQYGHAGGWYEHPERKQIAIEAEAAQQRGGLDVERLAFAIRLAFGEWRELTPPEADMRMAATAAAEYARLAPQPSADAKRPVPPADPPDCAFDGDVNAFDADHFGQGPPAESRVRATPSDQAEALRLLRDWARLEDAEVNEPEDWPRWETAVRSILQESEAGSDPQGAASRLKGAHRG